MILTPKRPTETVLYTFGWGKELGDDLIETFTLTLTSGTVVLTEEVNTGIAIQALISGGADGETATMLLTVNTALGQILKRNISLLIDANAVAEIPSTGTKRQIVEMIFEEAGLTPDEFDHTPEESATVLRRLDAMMGELKVQGVDMGYNFPPTFGTSDLNDDAGIPDFAINTVVLWVALRAFPALGKTMSAESKAAFSQGMIALRTAYAVIPDRVLPAGTVRGAGAKPWSTWWPFTGADTAA